MIIPLAIPEDGLLVNLTQIVTMRVHKAGRCDECDDTHIVGQQLPCTVTFSNGSQQIFSAESSHILNAEMHFALNAYRSFQIQVTSQIVTPNGDTASRLM